MTELADRELLAEFARTESETAFATLVARHVNLVYSTALRFTGNPHHAEEITQAVFIILARKAGKLTPRTMLSGWLYQTTRLTAANFVKGEFRRQQREQEAYMQSALTEPDTMAWEQIAPQLDEAMGRLGETDRNAIILRFFENKSGTETAALLGIREEAAHKRTARALEKLRKFFTKRGVTLTVTAIAGAVTANSVHAAPLGLAQSVTAVALATGATASASTLTLVKGTMKMMTWMKLKFAVILGVAVLFTAGAVATNSLSSKEGAKSIAFEAEGTIIYATAIDPRGSYTDTKHFVVTRDGNLWKIRTTTVKEERIGMGGPIGDSMDLFYEMGFDGTNIYRLNQQDEKKVLSPIPANERYKWVSAEGDVVKSDSPPCYDIHQCYSVWLPYCSAPYFRNLSGDKAVSPEFATRDFIGEPMAKLQSPAKWKAHDRFFINDVSWLSDETFRAFMAGGKETTLKYQAPYNTPFVWGRFENLTWTNWNGISFPSGFKITVSRPDFDSTKVAKFFTAYTVTGTLEQIRKAENFSPVPDLTTKTHITDWRNMRRSQPSMFVSTNFWEQSKISRP